MLGKDREIEIKIFLSKDAFFKIKERVKKISSPVKKLRQVDEYFTPIHRNFLKPEYPYEWLSVRRRGEKVILNYKHYYPENTEVTTHCDEFETQIKDVNQLDKIFSILNFRKLVKVEKEREVFIYNNEFEIALDVVKELGYFIEIEAIKDFGSVEATREKLFELAKSLEIDISKIDKRGYPFLLMEKKGLIK